MTQIKEGLIKSQPYTHVDMNTENDYISEDKNDSELCNIALSDKAEKIVVELNLMHGESKKKILELIQTLRADKLKDHEIKKVLFSRVNFVSRRTLYNALPQELKREYTKPKPLPKTINVSTEHKVIDVEPVKRTQEEIDLEDEKNYKNWAEHLDKQKEEEEPTPLELAEIKIKHLEEALHKTEQFKPATQLQEIDIVNTVVVKAGLDKIELAVHNEISSMRNRGWKTVEITMRAV